MRELNIDWAALHSAFQMNMPEVRCFLSMEDGRVLKLPPGDSTLAAVRADPQRFIPIEAIPSRIQYQWLDEFIKSIEAGEVRDRMEAAINGKGAFRRFKDILLALPEERRRWFEYRDQMMRQRIIEWVCEQGVQPLNEAPWANGQMDGQIFVAPVAPSENAPVTHTGSIGNTQPTQQHVPNLGNTSLRPAAKNLANNPHEVEALRDFLIEYFDKRPHPNAPGPLELEEVAGEISKRFHVQSLHH